MSKPSLYPVFASFELVGRKEDVTQDSRMSFRRLPFGAMGGLGLVRVTRLYLRVRLCPFFHCTSLRPFFYCTRRVSRLRGPLGTLIVHK